MSARLDALARRILFVPVAAVRPYLLLKCTLLLVAFDVWLTRISHGGRYGAGGFNVAHFAWLDAIQPDVSPALYVGITTLTGLLCFAIALAPRPPRWLLAVAFVLHTWSWAMSMLDSYQHHYLLSIVLLALIFFPRLRAEDALLLPEPKAAKEPPAEQAPKKKKKRSKGKPAAPAQPNAAAPKAAASSFLSRAPSTAGWAYVVLAWSIAIVYAYAAYSKTADEWLAGVAMQRVLKLPEGGVVPPGAEDPIGVFRSFAGVFGFEGERFWWLMGHSVVIVQLVCAAGYLLAPFRDLIRSRIVSVFVWVALLTALSFHAGAEYMDLKIGWFSWYMILFALVYLTPGRALVVAARIGVPLVQRSFGPETLAARIVLGLALALVGATTRSWAWGGLGALLLAVTPVRMLLTSVSQHAERVPPHVGLVSAGAGALALVVMGYQIDLPGAPAAGIIGACALGAGGVGLLLARDHTRAIHEYGVGAALGALVFFVGVAQADVRFDFYRNVGGDHRRRGELMEAYRAYVKANRYAPERCEYRARRSTLLRERPDARAPVTGRLAQGTLVEVAERRGGWARLRSPSGWLAANDLDRCQYRGREEREMREELERRGELPAGD